jgi:hypothetical protein
MSNLTEEDKNWIATTVCSIVEGRVDASEDRMKALIEGRLDAAEDRIKALIAKSDFDLETKLVAEFWKWGRSSDARTREAISDSTAATAKA